MNIKKFIIKKSVQNANTIFFFVFFAETSWINVMISQYCFLSFANQMDKFNLRHFKSHGLVLRGPENINGW